MICRQCWSDISEWIAVSSDEWCHCFLFEQGHPGSPHAGYITFEEPIDFRVRNDDLGGSPFLCYCIPTKKGPWIKGGFCAILFWDMYGNSKLKRSSWIWKFIGYALVFYREKTVANSWWIITENHVCFVVITFFWQSGKCISEEIILFQVMKNVIGFRTEQGISRLPINTDQGRSIQEDTLLFTPYTKRPHS